MNTRITLVLDTHFCPLLSEIMVIKKFVFKNVLVFQVECTAVPTLVKGHLSLRYLEKNWHIIRYGICDEYDTVIKYSCSTGSLYSSRS